MASARAIATGDGFAGLFDKVGYCRDVRPNA
jgi:hypothetical protein